MLSEGIAAKRGRYGAYLFRDMVNRRLRARRGARLAAITSGGAIPDTALFTVVAQPEEIVVGTVDEDFAVESNAGDIMLLGNTSWRIRRVESNTGRMLVEDAHGAPPTVPFWRGEAPARTDELSLHVAESARAAQHDAAQHEAGPFPPIPELEALGQHRRFSGDEIWPPLRASPPRHRLHARSPNRRRLAQRRMRSRRFRRRTAHRIHRHRPRRPRRRSHAADHHRRALLRRRRRHAAHHSCALRRPHQQSLGTGAAQALLPLASTSNCRPPPPTTASTSRSPSSTAFRSPTSFISCKLKPCRRSSSKPRCPRPSSPRAGAGMPTVRSRCCAFRAARKFRRRFSAFAATIFSPPSFPTSLPVPRIIEGDIKIPDHPLIHEVMKDVLTEAMDIDGLRRVIDGIRSGAIRCLAVDTPVPSQFSHEILNANPYAYLDDAPLEERRARAVADAPHAARSGARTKSAGSISRRSPGPRRSAARRSRRRRTARHLADAGRVTRWRSAIEDWQQAHRQLDAVRRSGDLRFESNWRAVRATRRRSKAALSASPPSVPKTFALIFPDAQFETAPPDLPSATADRDDAILAMISGWMMHTGPVTANALAYWLGLTTADVDKALLRLEAAGTILRGNFTGHDDGRQTSSGASVVCSPAFITSPSPRCASRSSRSPPRSSCDGCLRWQHVAPQSQLSGERGLLEVLRQLQGFEIPANAWEKQILARRVNEYDPAALDQLCLTGAVGWGRLSPHPATLEDCRRRPTPCRSHQRCAHHLLRARRIRLDAATAQRSRAKLRARAQPRRARGARIPASSRSVVLRRHRARHRQAQGRSRNRAVGAGRRRYGHC